MPLQELLKSLSARRAWIEIEIISQMAIQAIVALRKESVDRNDKSKKSKTEKQVALRKESVDRNVRPPAGPHVAQKSLSARRAWIEIAPGCDSKDAHSGRSPQGERG